MKVSLNENYVIRKVCSTRDTLTKVRLNEGHVK